MELFVIIFSSTLGFILILAGVFYVFFDFDDFRYRRKVRKYYRIKYRIKRLESYCNYLDNFYFGGDR